MGNTTQVASSLNSGSPASQEPVLLLWQLQTAEKMPVVAKRPVTTAGHVTRELLSVCQSPAWNPTSVHTAHSLSPYTWSLLGETNLPRTRPTVLGQRTAPRPRGLTRWSPFWAKVGVEGRVRHHKTRSRKEMGAGVLLMLVYGESNQ